MTASARASMRIAPYRSQAADWPTSGRHILAHFDADTIHVYQAYGHEIAEHALARQRFGAGFRYTRMSWIKPNFLWMMFRSGWASKPGQERVLAVRLPRAFFDALLLRAVPSSQDPVRGRDRDAWRRAIVASDVRLQWDPDHDPAGRPIARRALQLGLRGDALRQYGEQQPVSIEDITPFLLAQRAHAGRGTEHLWMPLERVYRPEPAAAASVAIDAWP